MEQIVFVWAVIKVRCTSCKSLTQLDVLPLVPMIYVGLLGTLIVAWLAIAVREARRVHLLLAIVVAVFAGPVLIFTLVGLPVLFAVVLLLKLAYFAFALGWRRACPSCNARSMTIYDLGVGEFWKTLWASLEEARR